MNKTRKLAVLGMCALSATGLAACDNNSGNYKVISIDDVQYNYVIVDAKDEKLNILYEIKNFSFHGYAYGNILLFVTKDDKHFSVRMIGICLKKNHQRHFMMLNMVQKSGMTFITQQ